MEVRVQLDPRGETLTGTHWIGDSVSTKIGSGHFEEQMNLLC
jgi:hypothetical protein